MDLATYLQRVLNRSSPMTIDLTNPRPREGDNRNVVIDLTHIPDEEHLEPTLEEQIEIFLRLVELESTNRQCPRKKGLTKKEINKFGCWRVRKSHTKPELLVIREDLEVPKHCSICLEDFRANVMVRNLPCSHFFHKACIDKWLSQNETCPLDRTIVK